MRVVQPYKNVALNRYTLYRIVCIVDYTAMLHTITHISTHTHTSTHTHIHSSLANTHTHIQVTHRTSDLPYECCHTLTAHSICAFGSEVTLCDAFSLAIASFNETHRMSGNFVSHEKRYKISLKMYFCTPIKRNIQ